VLDDLVGVSDALRQAKDRTQAMLPKQGKVTNDGKPGHLWPSDLAAAHSPFLGHDTLSQELVALLQRNFTTVLYTSAQLYRPLPALLPIGAPSNESQHPARASFRHFSDSGTPPIRWYLIEQKVSSCTHAR